MNTKLKVPLCMKCLYRDAEYFCKTCKLDLCTSCKENHVIDLNTKEHDVVIDRLKYGDFTVPESCKKHADKFYHKWCDQCDTPFCNSCNDHSSHKLSSIGKIYDKMWREHENQIVNIRSEILLNNCALLRGIKSDIEQSECTKLKTQYRLSMENKALKMKCVIDCVLMEMTVVRKLKQYMKAKLHTETKAVKRHINTLQYLVGNSECPVVAPVQFLLVFKKAPLSEKMNIPKNCSKLPLLSLSQGINKELVVSFLSEIDVLENRKRKVRKKHLLKQIPTEFLKFIQQSVINRTYHISCVTSETFWISDYYKHLVLLNLEGKPLHQLNDMKAYGDGVYTVTSLGELIYVDNNDNICKISQETETYNRMILIKRIKEWEPLCIHFSSSYEELLVGMGSRETQTAMVNRYTSLGQKIQTIKGNNYSQSLYIKPIYITEK
ncbi:uncharacterized protein LOC133193936 [Saccostrea echinata]|uniref:uncharacterized protein LOC133193936 n=1 Tax=Saccostrea echinata TaxID=191078 RepID=UPI002A807D90|nr:uncharacterized protein LOC133193936 [Saccostrea echinata]